MWRKLCHKKRKKETCPWAKHGITTTKWWVSTAGVLYCIFPREKALPCIFFKKKPWLCPRGRRTLPSETNCLLHGSCSKNTKPALSQELTTKVTPGTRRQRLLYLRVESTALSGRQECVCKCVCVLEREIERVVLNLWWRWWWTMKINH